MRADESGPGFPESAEWTLDPPTVEGLTVTVTAPAGVTADSFEIGWGDGSPPDYAGTGDEVTTHTYTAAGTYTLYVDPFGDDYVPQHANVTVSDEAPEPPPEELTEGEAEQQPAEVFDPGAHTVTEVQMYVEANPDQAGAIRDAETAGQARSTLLTWLDSRQG